MSSNEDENMSAYRRLLLEFLAAEENGAEYCHAYAMTFAEGSPERSQMELLATLERAVVELVAALVTRAGGAHGTLPRANGDLKGPPLSTPWSEMLDLVERSVPPYLERLERLREVAPDADQALVDAIVRHEVAIGDWARASRASPGADANADLHQALRVVEAALSDHARLR